MTDQLLIEYDIPTKMQDGTVLRSNIFRPAAEGIYPVVVARTPYGKDTSSVNPFLDVIRFARKGYIVVIQDVRGRYCSEGKWVPFIHEFLDGYDTVEWAAGLPGSNGQVGMYGPSYLGFTQWAAAIQSPAHLKAIMPSFTWADGRNGLFWRGGAFELGCISNWQLYAIASDVIQKRSSNLSLPEKQAAIDALIHEIDGLNSEGYWSLPLKDFVPFKRLDIFNDYWSLFVKNPYGKESIASVILSNLYSQIKVPAYNIGGWYDIFSQGTLNNFSALKQTGSTSEARQSKLLMGPWWHLAFSSEVGEMDFGYKANLSSIDAEVDLTDLTQRWYDFWLKGLDNGVIHDPPVKLFVMGENQWRTENEWPLTRAMFTPFYLHSQGCLSANRPVNQPPDHYIYDPTNPVITCGGALQMTNCYYPGVKDQRILEKREDVLIYKTEPLKQDMEVTGSVTVKLWAASDALDTDFVARLIDVFPDGYAQNVTDGIIRARFRNGEAPELLEPDRPYEFVIDLWSTSNLFKAGHCVRLDITSSNFPRWDRNLNNGEPLWTEFTPRKAHQTIFHDPDRPSHVLLPLTPH